ncbi:MAG: hypothetical protein K2W93_19180, partial [Burkholderiaceae bacterium]|nr:hypothetical protein [Burkholderiaceae bacterium]
MDADLNPSPANSSAAAPPKKVRLGDVLVQQQLISEQQLSQALELQRASGKKLGRLLIDAGLITEEALAHVLA